ncbi:SEI2 [Linum grandiflorum]
MEEPPNPQGNNRFPPQPNTLYDSIKCILFKAAINGAERLMLDGKKKKKKHNFIHTLENRGSPVFGDEMLLIRNHHKSRPFIPISSIVKLPHFLMTKFIAFQIHLLTSFFTFPVRVTSLSISALKHAVLGQLVVKNIVLKLCGAVVNKAIENSGGGVTRKCSTRDVAVKLGRGVVWSCYVGLVLAGMLACGFLFGSLLVSSVVEAPFQGKEALNFDYTKDSPVAYLPLDVPHSRKLQLAVSLVMPESDYNRKLGMFQVRVELLTSMGKVMKTTSSPCILQFKSQPIRLAETLIKSFPLLIGAMSESQTVELRMDELSAGGIDDPTASIKVSLDQRAEYKIPGAGIPEVYAAWLKLESQLPRAKRLLWQWRRTVYIWTGILLFLIELVLAFVFCRPLIIPAAGFGTKSSSRIVKVFAAKKFIE